MAAPSIAALYRNPDEPSSAKKRQFTYEEMLSFVEFSGASHSVRALTISALQARGKWPHEDGPASTVLSVAILGMMLEGVCCRSTVQRRIKRAVHLGFWRRTREANSWTNCPQCSKPRTTGKCECGYKGRSRDANGNWTGEFLRVPVYEFDIEKFRTAPRCREIRQFDARTYAEHKAAAKRGEHPNVAPWPSRTSPEQPPPKAPAPARPQEPLPQRDQPAAEHDHRSAGRSLTSRQRKELHERIKLYEAGRTEIRDVNGYVLRALQPGTPEYIKPLPHDMAILAASQSMARGDPDRGLDGHGVAFQKAREAALEMENGP